MAQDEDLPPPKADFSAPPPYEQATATHIVQMPMEPTTNDRPMEMVVNMEVPSMEPNMIPEAPLSKLPTYEEVQMEKTLLGEMPMDLTGNTFPIHGAGRIPPPSHPVLISALRNAHAQGGAGGPPTMAVGPNGTLTFIAIEAGDTHGRSHSRGVQGVATGATSTSVDNSLLGTDFMFLAAFIVAFLFNWIGFLMLTCFFHTIAARYGALSGFGLSLAKWTLIVKKSTDLASHESSWLWWLIMAFGCLICVRALVQYISIKRTWRMMSASAQERLLFFA